VLFGLQLRVWIHHLAHHRTLPLWISTNLLTSSTVSLNALSPFPITLVVTTAGRLYLRRIANSGNSSITSGSCRSFAIFSTRATTTLVGQDLQAEDMDRLVSSDVFLESMDNSFGGRPIVPRLSPTQPYYLI